MKKSRLGRSFFLAGLLLLSLPLISSAQPTFVNGSPQTFTVCSNSTNNQFGTPYLTIVDPTPGVPETWTIVSGPTYGTSAGLPWTGFSTGSTLTTAGTIITYTPNTNYVGPDAITIQVSNGTDSAITTINIVVSPLPSLVINSVVPVCAGTTSTTLIYSALANVGPTSAFYNANASFIVPPGVNSIDFDLQGAAGGGDNVSGAPNPGLGGRVQGTLQVTPGHTLYITTGGRGADGSPSGAAGGANGGGNAFFYFFGCGGAGGGATDIRLDANTLNARIAVAGGGGGNGWDSPGPFAGGAGGNLIGGSSANNAGGSHSGGGITSGTLLGSGGAHATYVGWTPGGNGSFGVGGDGSVQGVSGGGGGGYFGGGGGVWTGGGGGSSYTDPTIIASPVYTQGYNIGSGVVSMNYTVNGYYDIAWDAVPASLGFADASGIILPMPPGSISIALPATAPAGTYTGKLTVHNPSCQSDPYPFSVTINPLPTVDPVLDQTLCNGDTTNTIYLTGSMTGTTTFNWTNSEPGIGIPSNGSGDIFSFNATNAGTAPVNAHITVTPVANGCSGDPLSFTMHVNPTPSLTSGLSPAAICDSSTFSYVPTSATTGTTFTWFRDSVAGIIELTASGADNPNEVLFNTSPNPVVVPYVYTLEANTCFTNQTVNVVVNPRPMLSSSLTPPAICNGTLFSYAPASATAGVIFTWNRNTVTGISNAAATGANNPLEVLHNTTNDSVLVPYVYTLTANGCSYSQTVWVTVYPSPALSSTTSPAAHCDSTLFSYTATSATSGTTYAWSRGSMIGITNPATNGLTAAINEYLVNTTNHPINVAYNFTLTAHGCSNPQTVVVTINPKPMLSSSITPAVCDSILFAYMPTSGTAGTSFSWTRDTVTGITNAAGAGATGINEYLHNTTTHSIIVTYKYTMLANGCTNTENMLVTVNPKPKLSSSLTPAAICDSTAFNYTPTSNTAGASFAWFRPYIAGIYAVAQTGTGNPNQILINSTYVPVNVVYTYTISANGCVNTQNVVVAVNPTPKLNPPYTASVCSGQPFRYTPTSYTPGALFQWNRPVVSHITPGGAFSVKGTGVINDTLYDDVLAPQHVDYVYRLSIGACTNLGTQTLRLTVNPAPQIPQIVVFPDDNPCNNTLFQTFGASAPEAANVSYNWTAVNATIFSESNNHQFALVNFDHPGTAIISINSNVNGFGCISSNSRAYTVGGSAANNPTIIYYNGQFVCLRNDNASYQWGYDDATTLVSTQLDGQIDQSYTNGNPDFIDNHYWCITKQADGCWQKSYYNAPSGVNDINAGLVDMKVFPNPASEVLNVEINSSVTGKMSLEVVNMLGQTVATQVADNHKAAISVGQLPSGAYMVECFRDGNKVATTRFIKN